MAKNLKFYLDDAGAPCARGPQTEKLLMNFLEHDISADEHICRDLMEDLHAVESDSVESREYVSKTHTVTIEKESATIRVTNSETPQATGDDAPQPEISLENPALQPALQKASNHSASETGLYETGLKHFREIIEDWEAFILEEVDP